MLYIDRVEFIIIIFSLEILKAITKDTSTEDLLETSSKVADENSIGPYFYIGDVRMNIKKGNDAMVFDRRARM